MSVDELNVTVESEMKEIMITVADELPSTELIVESFPDVYVVASGNMGPQVHLALKDNGFHYLKLNTMLLIHLIPKHSMLLLNKEE